MIRQEFNFALIDNQLYSPTNSIAIIKTRIQQ